MKKALTHIILFLLTSTTAFAQNFPVQSIVNITPPFSVYLSDYASISSDKLLVTLMLKDISQPDIQVKLRLTIKGNGIELRTKADYQPQPLLLQGGAPLLISGTELEGYLNPANLDFSGLGKSEFIKTGKLPEGVYQFMAEAVEYRRNVVVSNNDIRLAWLVLNDPPRWTLPMANSLLTATYPQNIFFSWMPMSTASPNSAFTTEYEFTMVELWPDNRAPGDAINSSIPVYQTTTINTSLVYGPAEPELVPGRKYVCRLRAYDTEKRDLFKNKGYSEILVFTFGQACKPPNTFQHQVLGPEDARVNWTSLPGNTQFTLSYAEQNADGTWSNWYHNEAMVPFSAIKGLKPEHTYRYQLKAICGTLESEYSEIKQFSTPAPDTAGVECGKDISIPKLDDSPPLPVLKVGDIINVGGFEARIIEVEGSGGSFSGKCAVNVKTFGGVRILSEFENISINESHQVTAGVINSVKGELNIIGLDGILDSLGITGNDDVVGNEGNGDPNVGDPYEAGDSVLVVLGDEEIIITGDTTIITAAGDTIVTDFSQIPPIITVNGDPTDITTDKLDFDNPGGGTDGGDLAHAASDTSAYSINYVQFLPFKESDDKVPGFDAYDPGIPPYRGEYKDKKVNKEEYIIPWQSVEANGKPAKVNMVIDTKVPDSIQTRLKVEMKGSPLNFLASPDGDTIRILNLVGQSNEDEDLVTASYIKDDGDEVPVGYLNLVSYESQPFNVVIVPVDGEFKYTASALQSYLDKVYSPAFVSWTVDVAGEPLEVEYDEGEANGLNTSRTLVSKFNSEMKAIIDAMEKRGDYVPADNTYYLFVMNKAENESLNGLMPFNSKYGFLFTGNGPDQTQLFRTIAHELGHGVFKLQHNFDKFKEIEKRSTQNLMDYTTTPETATILRKFQWDEIISPRLIALGWSEESYAETTYANDVISAIRYSNTNAYLSHNITSISTKWALKGSLNVNLGKLLEPATKIDYTIHKNGIEILSNEFNKELVKNTKRVKIFFYESPESIITYIDKTKPAVTLELEEIQLDKFYEYLGISEIIEVKTLDISKSVDKEILDDIIANRDHVNDRTNKAIYGNNAIKQPAGYDGYVYYGKETATPNIEGNSFIKKVKGLLWKELEKEGAASAINAYDGQHFTWGKGFAAGGELENLIANLLTNVKYKQLFQNMGIMIVDKHLWVVSDDGEWLKDVPNPKKPRDMSGYAASIYIKNSTKLLSFFAEFAENPEYSQDFVDAQYNLLQEKKMTIPSYIIANETSTSYEASWNDETTVLLFHLSHWLPAGDWHYRASSYKNTKGDLAKVLYIFILTAGKGGASAGEYNDRIYKWTTQYNILRFLSDAGIPAGGGITKLEATWSNNLIDLEFLNDKNSILRVVKTTTKTDPNAETIREYITNSDCVLIKKLNKYYIITEDGKAITTATFEAPK